MFKTCFIIIYCHVTANHLYSHYHHGSVQLQLAEEHPVRLKRSVEAAVSHSNLCFAMRIRPENEKIENHEKQRLTTLKRLKRGDDNELKRNLRLEKVVAGKQLRLSVETEEERRTRLENDAAILKSWQICLSFKLDVLTT